MAEPCPECVLLIQELEKRLAQRFAMEDDTRRGLANSLNHRLEEMNQFRAQILTERSIFVRQDAYDERHEALVTRMSRLEGWQQRLMGIGIVMMLVAGIIGAVLERTLLK